MNTLRKIWEIPNITKYNLTNFSPPTYWATELSISGIFEGIILESLAHIAFDGSNKDSDKDTSRSWSTPTAEIFFDNALKKYIAPILQKFKEKQQWQQQNPLKSLW